MHLRLELFEYGKPYRCTHHEDAAVPPIITGCNVLRGQFGGRLFDKTVDAMRAVFQRVAQADIAEAGIGARRRNAERGDLAGLRMTCGDLDGAMQRRQVCNGVIRRHGHEDRVLAVGAGGQRGQRQRGRCIAACRLDHDARRHAALANLLAGSEAMFFAAHDHRLRSDVPTRGKALHAQHGCLQQRLGAHHADQLLRKLFARYGPQARTRTACENYLHQPPAIRRHDGSNLCGHHDFSGFLDVLPDLAVHFSIPIFLNPFPGGAVRAVCTDH